MGCALDTCRDTDSEANTPEGEPEEIELQVTASQSRPLSVPPPSPPPPSPPLVSPSVLPPIVLSIRELPNSVVIQITDELRAALNLTLPESRRPVDYDVVSTPDVSTASEMERYVLSPSRNVLAEDDRFPQQSSRPPSNFTIVDRNAFYKSFPPTTNKRKVWNKRMKRQGYGVYEGPRAIFRLGRRNRETSSVCRRCSTGFERPLPDPN